MRLSMMLFKKNLIIAFSLLFTVIFSQERKRPVTLAIKGDFTQPATSVIFPEFWAGFQRESIQSYDPQNKHIVVSYVQQITKKNKTTLTLYLYPKKIVDNQLLRDNFEAYHYVLYQNSNKKTNLKPSFGSLSNDNAKVNYTYSIFDHALGERDFFKGVKFTDKSSLLAIYECGTWDFKTRVSSDNMTKAQISELKEKVENYFGILNIAAKNPLPIENVPDLRLSPIVKRDSMMTKATIAAAEAKIEWMKNNLEKKEVMTGFNDMKIDSEVYSIEKMIEFYKAHENDWTMQESTKNYFSEMIRIADNGRIKDHIYDKYKGLIDYQEGADKEEDYNQFKIDKGISTTTNEILYSLFYRIQ
ncbi:hypothetical protein [Chryseobacterium artocarpi]|nr:hypothetical protein [Chryseobacterium artocarpi]